jgi:hypothetical protein
LHINLKSVVRLSQYKEITLRHKIEKNLNENQMLQEHRQIASSWLPGAGFFPTGRLVSHILIAILTR